MRNFTLTLALILCLLSACGLIQSKNLTHTGSESLQEESKSTYEKREVRNAHKECSDNFSCYVKKAKEKNNPDVCNMVEGNTPEPWGKLSARVVCQELAGYNADYLLDDKLYNQNNTVLYPVDSRELNVSINGTEVNVRIKDTAHSAIVGNHPSKSIRKRFSYFAECDWYYINTSYRDVQQVDIRYDYLTLRHKELRNNTLVYFTCIVPSDGGYSVSGLSGVYSVSDQKILTVKK